MDHILIADTSDLIEIRDIWEDKFPADEQYQQIMFSQILPICTNYIMKSGTGTVISVTSLMPMRFLNEQKGVILNGWYMFGVATRSGFEGKGYASRLINHAISKLERDNYSFIFERPADQSLINFYLNFGFTKLLKKKDCRFDIITRSCKEAKESKESKESKDAEYVINKLRLFPKRFEWGSSELLEKLINIGEIERHQELLTPESLLEECYIAVKPLNGTPESLFDDAFFCFPLE